MAKEIQHSSPLLIHILPPTAFVCKEIAYIESRTIGFVWLEEWKSGRMENCGRMEKWEDGKYLVFPLVCLVGGVENWDDEKLFCLVGEKKRRMKNVIYIN